MQYPTLIHERVALARAGQNPTVICQMPSGWAVLGDVQFIPGYCLLLADPVVPSLNDLPAPARGRYLLDASIVGDALLECTDAYRINYEILGNQDPALHCHIFPRYCAEPPERIRGPVWHYPPEQRNSVRLDAQRDRPLMDRVRQAILKRL